MCRITSVLHDKAPLITFQSYFHLQREGTQLEPRRPPVISDSPLASQLLFMAIIGTATNLLSVCSH
jgi:hypothetical protein